MSSELAPIAGVDTAVSHRCMPLEPFLCWQYDKAARALPVWVLQFITVQASGRVDFQYPENGGLVELEQGDWVVLLNDEEQLVTVVSPEEFAAAFRMVFQ